MCPTPPFLQPPSLEAGNPDSLSLSLSLSSFAFSSRLSLSLSLRATMARVLAQSQTLKPQTLTLIRSLSPSLLTPHRSKSNRAADEASFIEIDLGSGSGSDLGGGEVHIGTKRIEDAIHTIFAQKSAPDWLPFLPGSSYWVPPKDKRTAVAAADFVRLVKTTLLEPLTEEEALSFRTVRGWPSSSFFFEGAGKKRPKKTAAQSDDDE